MNIKQLAELVSTANVEPAEQDGMVELLIKFDSFDPISIVMSKEMHTALLFYYSQTKSDSKILPGVFITCTKCYCTPCQCNIYTEQPYSTCNGV